MNDYKINPDNENISIRILLERVQSGYELQETEGELTEDEILKYNGSIILEPEYQREYRFTLDDEIKLIESVLIGIPIPPIFLATDKMKGVRVTNVVDGQHRLRALYRFFNNEFKLNGLTLLNGFDGKKFSDLALDIKSDFAEKSLIVTIFKDFPGIEFELEIFNRYNKGTKPLSPQEIRHAVYNSKFNTYVNEFTFTLYKKEPDSILNKAYNVTKDRVQKKKVQEGIFVLLSILEEGINKEYKNSLMYAENYMEKKYLLEIENPVELEESYTNTVSLFESFNCFIMDIQQKYEYPFSKGIYGISSNYKFQISIAMILAGIFHHLTKKGISDKIISNEELKKTLLDEIQVQLRESFLEDPKYKASSTNSDEIDKLVKSIVNKLDNYKLN